MTDDERQRALFVQLVLTFQSAAWQQMGKIKNPLTDKIERNLEQARFSIDILQMIHAKTEGNLDKDEKAFLERAISELHINFVDEYNKKETPAEDTTKPVEAPAAEKEKPPAEKKAAKSAGPSKKKTKSGTGGKK